MEYPRALLEQSCCIGLIGKNVIIDCETRAEAEEVLDWLCDGRVVGATAQAAAQEQRIAELEEALQNISSFARKAINNGTKDANYYHFEGFARAALKGD